jgi:hypothetical protein
MNMKPPSPPRRLAIIGTAGRDKTKPMNAALWAAMLADLRARLLPGDILVSGGAAWADHLAVAAFLRGWAPGLRLYLPAPLTDGPGQPRFLAAGGGQSSGSAANYYHGLFRQATGVDGVAEIVQAVDAGAIVNAQPSAPGLGGMFARNRLVAQEATDAIAYTWGTGEPQDGGTRNTWLLLQHATREHVSLLDLSGQETAEQPTSLPRPRG